MKAFSLMLWLVSSEYWLTLENKLWRTRVDGPDRDKHTEHLITSPKSPTAIFRYPKTSCAAITVGNST